MNSEIGKTLIEGELARMKEQAEEMQRLAPQAVDLEPLKNGEVTARRPNRKQRRYMTRSEKQKTGAARELRQAKDILKRAGKGELMVTVRSRNAA